MGLNHTDELLVRMQALPFEAVFPTSEKGASAAFGAVIPELPEGLLQNIGGVQAPEDSRHDLLSGVREVEIAV